MLSVWEAHAWLSLQGNFTHTPVSSQKANFLCFNTTPKNLRNSFWTIFLYYYRTSAPRYSIDHISHRCYSKSLYDSFSVEHKDSFEKLFCPFNRSQWGPITTFFKMSSYVLCKNSHEGEQMMKEISFLSDLSLLLSLHLYIEI